MTTNMQVIALTCIGVANHALSGKLTFDEFKKQWPLETDMDQLLWKLMHETEHFLVDQDIREKDPSYEIYQRDLVRSLIIDVEARYCLTAKPNM